MHHGVGVFDPDAVGTEVCLHDVHHRVVGSSERPIALPFEHRGESRYGLCARLNYTLHRVVVRQLAYVTAAILDDVDFVTIVYRLYRGKSHAGFRPQSGQNDLLAASFFDRCHEVLVIPGVHRRPLDGFLAGIHRSELRPHISAERLRFDSREYNRQFEYSCGLSERDHAIDNPLAVGIADSEQHLWLMVDQRHNAIVGSEQPFFTALWTDAAWTHLLIPPFMSRLTKLLPKPV